MSQVVRAFTWDSWRLVKPRGEKKHRVIQETFRTEVTATGPCIVAQGHEAALSRLQEKIGTWLMVNWRNALLLPAANYDLQQRAMQDASFLAHCVVQAETNASGLADYLLCQVCEPLLRSQGLVITSLRLRRGCENYATVSLPDELVATYLADMKDQGTVQYRAKGLRMEAQAGKTPAQGATHVRTAQPQAHPQ